MSDSRTGSRGEDELTRTLRYFEEIGFEGLYLSPGGKAAETATGKPPEAAAGRGSSSRSTRSAAARPVERGPASPSPASAASRPEPSGGSFAESGGAPSAGAFPEAGAGASPADLESLARRAQTCTRCRLAEGRRTVVFGSGDPHADLLFVGEGPGAQEDRQGLPFVGPAGQLLTKIIQAIDLTREQVYIANVVKCRPPNNRDPQPDEVAACREYLEGQIRAIEPKVIVALGRVAAQSLLSTGESLGRLRGRWHEVLGIETRVTYHPAALLRNASFKRPTWEDMQLVRDRLRELS